MLIVLDLPSQGNSFERDSTMFECDRYINHITLPYCFYLTVYQGFYYILLSSIILFIIFFGGKMSVCL